MNTCYRIHMVAAFASALTTLVLFQSVASLAGMPKPPPLLARAGSADVSSPQCHPMSQRRAFGALPVGLEPAGSRNQCKEQSRASRATQPDAEAPSCDILVGAAK